MWKDGKLVILEPIELQSFGPSILMEFCSNVSAMECEMQVGALSSIVLMNIYIKIKKGVNMFGKKIINSFVNNT